MKRGTANVEKKEKRKKVDREMRERIRWAGCSANGRDSIAVELESLPPPPSSPSRFPLQLELVDVHGELLVGTPKKGSARPGVYFPPVSIIEKKKKKKSVK